MKKIVCLTAALLFVAGAILTESAVAQKTTPFTKANMNMLKGKWEGSADFGSGFKCQMVLEITNDAPPFKGNVGWYNIPVGQMQFPGNFSGDTKMEGPFENGILSNKGNFLIQGQGGNFGEFSLMGKDLDGWFYIWGARGTARLKKK